MEKTKVRSMKIHVHYDCKTLNFHLNANDSQTYFPARIPLYNQMAGVHFHWGSNSLQYFKVSCVQNWPHCSSKRAPALVFCHVVVSHPKTSSSKLGNWRSFLKFLPFCPQTTNHQVLLLSFYKYFLNLSSLLKAPMMATMLTCCNFLPVLSKTLSILLSGLLRKISLFYSTA